jgi:hypothetical protein
MKCRELPYRMKTILHSTSKPQAQKWGAQVKLYRSLTDNANILIVVISAVIILFPLGYSVASYVLVGDPPRSQSFLERPDEKYKDCVRETTYMRFHHWELLRGIREEVVRYGKRGEIGINKCRECHTSRERFCDECHNAVTASPDCFECHYYP